MSLLRALILGTFILSVTSSCASLESSLYSSVQMGQRSECTKKIDTERERCEQRTAMSFTDYQQKKCEMLAGEEKKRCRSLIVASTIAPYERESQ